MTCKAEHKSVAPTVGNRPAYTPLGKGAKWVATTQEQHAAGTFLTEHMDMSEGGHTLDGNISPTAYPSQLWRSRTWSKTHKQAHIQTLKTGRHRRSEMDGSDT